MRLQAEKGKAERQRLIKNIPAPKMYGKETVYIGAFIAGVIFAMLGSYFWFIVNMIGCGIYFAISYRDYKKFLKNSEALNSVGEVPRL